jgi:integrase
MSEIRKGVYRVRVYVGRSATGAPKFKSETITGKRNALNRMDEMEAEVQRAAEPVAGDETVGDLLDAYIEHCRYMDRSPTTVRKYESLAEHIKASEIGKIRIVKLTPADLNRLYRSETARGLAATSVRHVHTLIGAALHHAERLGWVTQNVSKRSSPPPVRSKRLAPPDIEAVIKIGEEASRRDDILAPAVLLAALTGMRRGELCALRWSDVDWKHNRLDVSRSVYEMAGGGWGEKPTKTHAHRKVSLDELGITTLKLRLEDATRIAESTRQTLLPDGFVFSKAATSSEPIRPDVLSKFTARVMKAAGVEGHLHMLRHFSATQLIAAGYDPVTVAARLGHRDASITLNIYSHALIARDEEAAATLGRALTAGGG